jgi:glycosyltransferase involved in cell wall biosynthesis
MKICFFGRHGSFDYANIGGSNSLIRRLARELIHTWDYQVDCIFYGSSCSKEIIHVEGICSKYYRSLKDALNALDGYDHIISIYISLSDIPRYMQYCVLHKDDKYFHFLYQSWPDSILKREFTFSLSKLPFFNGIPFAVSPRLLNRLWQWNSKATLLWPPVPKEYFVTPSNKTSPHEIRVTFIGRIDIGKGILETIEIFNRLSERSDVELNLYGIHWNNDSAAVKIHKQLSEQKRFLYKAINFNGYHCEIDDMVRSLLNHTDIFIQPYRRLSSTIDTPLLILEAMASLCAVITIPYGDILDIYGESRSLISDSDTSEKIVNLILSAKEWLPEERKRIYNKINELNFDEISVAKKFVDSINNIR